jgi:Tfp pilus assembly protein PilF
MIRDASLTAMLICAALAGCGSGPLRDIPIYFGGAEQELAKGILAYEEGSYREAEQRLQASLDRGLKTKYDQVNAHKYLAFVHCVSNQERQCRDEFRKALDIDPSFELSKSEAGHPIWGPVFRSIKPKK